MNDTRTMRELAHEALDIQHAINLPALAHSFGRSAMRLKEIAREEGWENSINQHPVCILFSSRIAELTGSESSHEFAVAWDWCTSFTSITFSEE